MLDMQKSTQAHMLCDTCSNEKTLNACKAGFQSIPMTSLHNNMFGFHTQLTKKVWNMKLTRRTSFASLGIPLTCYKPSHI